MRKCIVSGFVAAGVAAAIIVPLTYGAHGQENSNREQRCNDRPKC